ncbi:YjbH domain-containing protein [Variovorax sp. dw_308]|uniref:YjbH domain-containing protein n=1 Tax=Variovorax sp. dw_308 TaxID=2721546 RepID=UPI001C48C9F7|nr:YjbH domain-containing protein [Variovorax sp. dw_308]
MALLALATQPALAQQDTLMLSGAGFTGLSVTPTAPLLRWGAMGVAYENEVVGARLTGGNGTSGHNLVVGFGLLPNLEISGRMAANTLNANCFNVDCGIRDLSFNFKAGSYLDNGRRWHAAVGATDLGGAATNFRTYYGVASYTALEARNLDFSLGYAYRSNRTAVAARAASPLNGPFASVAWRPVPWLQGQLEYTDGSSFAGARLYAPAEWLPAGWAAHIGANTRMSGDAHTSRNWFSVGLTVPLYKVSTERPAYTPPVAPGALAPSAAPRPATLEFSSVGLPASPPIDAYPAPLPQAAQAGAMGSPVRVTDDQLAQLAKALGGKGFEDISVGRLSDGAIAVKFNNATYNVNSVDGLGVALGVVARELGRARVPYRLVMTQRQVAIVGASGQTDCLAQWIALEKPGCPAVRLSAPGTAAVDASLDGAAWVVRGNAPSWSTARLMLQPVLRSSLGSEYGVFDYSLGVRGTLQQPLWKGAYVEASHVSPVTDSSDFRAGGVFGNSRIVDTTDRLLAHQVVRLPVELLFGQGNQELATRLGANALTAHIAAGRFDTNYRGVYGELRWEPGDGHHRFGVEGGQFDRTTEYDRYLIERARPLLASYRYAYTPTHTWLEATAGQFMNNDRGVKLGIKQWFHDVAVSVYVRRSKFDYQPTSHMFAGIEIQIPLTPRKDMSPIHHIQVVGNPRWTYAVETLIREDSNLITTNMGVMPVGAVLNGTFNSDRSGLVYLEENLPRLRSAAGK